MLNTRHREDLYGSGLNDETIRELGFFSGAAQEIADILGFSAGAGLVIPYPSVRESPGFCRVKPDNPLVIKDRVAKYLSPKGAMVRAYIPPKTREALKNPDVRVIITEGEKKAAKADQEGFPCIGLAGVWAFYQNHELIDDVKQVRWEGRPVFVAYDSDTIGNPDIDLALFMLERELSVRGARVKVVRIPPSRDGSKVGLDDFLVNEGPEALAKLLKEAKPPLEWELQDIAHLPPKSRLQPLRRLFHKLAKLDPVELEVYRVACQSQLNIPRRDFQAQLNVAREKSDHDSSVGQAVPTGIEHTSDTVDPMIRQRALTLLRDPALLYKVGKAIQQLGVAGEDANIRVLYLAITSRITEKPISVAPKGESSSGKSHMLDAVLQLFPESAYLLMTATTKQALFYFVEEESFAHRTIVIFERGGAEAADYAIRTLQSEGRLVLWVPQKDLDTGRWVTTKIEKEGPTNFIVTTTNAQLHPENETRQWSVIMDESAQLTQEAKVESAKRYESNWGRDQSDIEAWRQLQNELRPLQVTIPYAKWLARHTPNKPIRMRRDFPRLLVLIAVIALLHQYQRRVQGDTVIASLQDYFLARELVAQIFPASLVGISQKVEDLVSEVGRIYQRKIDAGDNSAEVRPSEIARAMETSSSSVSRWLRPAIENGLLEVVREVGKDRIASVRPGSGNWVKPSALPSIEEMAEAFPEQVSGFTAVHPVTGEEVKLEDMADTAEVKKNSGEGRETVKYRHTGVEN